MLRSGMVSLPRWSKNIFPFFLSLFITSILPFQFAVAGAGASSDRWINTGGPAAGSISALAINPTSPSTIYAGTGTGGVFKSVAGGANWTAMNTGLTTTNVVCLAINPTSPNTLYAGTYGGGVFKSTEGGRTGVL